jgi:hypothetical protein
LNALRRENACVFRDEGTIATMVMIIEAIIIVSKCFVLILEDIFYQQDVQSQIYLLAKISIFLPNSLNAALSLRIC